MNSARACRSVVVGLGNPILGDDGVGLAVAEEVGRLLAERPMPHADVVFSARGGFELIDLLSGYRRAILVDCLAGPNAIPGRIREVDLSQSAASVCLGGEHELGPSQVFALARKLGIEMPQDVSVFAVEVEDQAFFSEQMTPRVSAAVPALANRIYDCLEKAARPDRSRSISA